MNYTDSDIQAIVDTKTEQLQKEIKLKDEEYNILKITSEQLETEQQRQIYELQQKINKAMEKLKQYKKDLKAYQEQDNINHQNISIGLVGVKIKAFEDIFKEDE